MSWADNVLLVVLKTKNHSGIKPDSSDISSYVYMLFNVLQLSSYFSKLI